MLNIDVLSKKDSVVELRVWIKKRRNITKKIVVLQARDIEKEIETYLKAEYKGEFDSLDFLTKIRRLKNINSSDRTEQTLLVKFYKTDKEKNYYKTKKKPKKTIKSDQ